MRLVFVFFFIAVGVAVCSGSYRRPWWWSWWRQKNNGVTASKIVKEARKFNGRTDYSYRSCIHDNRYCNQYKCNLYVNDMLKKAGAKVPQRLRFAYSPIGANEWGNSRSTYVFGTGCYMNVRNVNQPTAGDVVAFPSQTGLGHVGIVTGSNQYISAGKKIVEESSIPNNRKKVYWRYLYAKGGC